MLGNRIFKLNMYDKYKVDKKTFFIFDTLTSYSLSQSNQNFKNACLKVCVGDCDDFKQRTSHVYGYNYS